MRPLDLVRRRRGPRRPSSVPRRAATLVVGGGLAVIVTGLSAWFFPELRRADRFVAPEAKTIADAGNKSFVDDGPPAMVAGLDPKAEKGKP